MLARRGLRPSLARPDLPFPPDISSETADALAERPGHYAFRLFVRGVIQHGDGFTPAETTSYLSAATTPAPSRVEKELWALGRHLYVVNSLSDLMTNIGRAIAEGLLSQHPPLA